MGRDVGVLLGLKEGNTVLVMQEGESEVRKLEGAIECLVEGFREKDGIAEVDGIGVCCLDGTAVPGKMPGTGEGARVDGTTEGFRIAVGTIEGFRVVGAIEGFRREGTIEGTVEGVRVVGAIEGFRREGTIVGPRNKGWEEDGVLVKEEIGKVKGMNEVLLEGMLERGALKDGVVVDTIEDILEVIKDGMIDGMKVVQAEGLLEAVVVFLLLGLIVVGRLVES